MIFLSILSWLFLIIGALVGLSFYTLAERKVMSYIQFRKGPNKVSFNGILQPFSDAIKLFSKQNLWLTFTNYKIYLMGPILSLFVAVVLWMTYPYLNHYLDLGFGGLFLFCCLGASVYSMLFGGWSSNSKFAYLGSIRAVSQSVSYEVSLALIILIPFFLSYSLSLFSLISYQIKYSFVILLFCLFPLWLISLLAELNRTPFDFAEGESELVSGFNIEYEGMMFGIIFMGEYLSMILMSWLTVLIFCGFNLSFFSFYLMFFSMLMFILWIRASMPRFRYDFLMLLCWKGFLPMVLFFFMYFLGLIYLLI